MAGNVMMLLFGQPQDDWHKPGKLDGVTPQQAMNAARNIARRCAINSHRNLFGPLIVEYGWTWIGPRGQTRAVSSGRDEEPSGLVASRCADERAQAAPWGRLL